MSALIGVIGITGADAIHHEATETLDAFDVVKVRHGDTDPVALHLPPGTGAAVAAAINAAVGG